MGHGSVADVVLGIVFVGEGGKDFCSCFENTNIKHQSYVGCVYQTRLHRYEDDTRLHYILIQMLCCVIPSRPNHPNFLTTKYTPQKKTQKLNFFPITTQFPKKRRDPRNWNSKLRRKNKRNKSFAFPGTHRRFNHPKIGVSGRVRSTLGPYLSSTVFL